MMISQFEVIIAADKDFQKVLARHSEGLTTLENTTPVSYSVTFQEKQSGKGIIKFSKKINMNWLSQNIDDFFEVSIISKIGTYGKAVSAQDKFKATNFDLENGLTIDFIISSFEAESRTINLDVKMDEAIYSEPGALFLQDQKRYYLTSVTAQAERPWEEEERLASE